MARIQTSIRLGCQRIELSSISPFTYAGMSGYQRQLDDCHQAQRLHVEVSYLGIVYRDIMIIVLDIIHYKYNAGS